MNHTEIEKVSEYVEPRLRGVVTRARAPVLACGKCKDAFPNLFSVVEKDAPPMSDALWVAPVVPRFAAVVPLVSSNGQCPMRSAARVILSGVMNAGATAKLSFPSKIRAPEPNFASAPAQDAFPKTLALASPPEESSATVPEVSSNFHQPTKFSTRVTLKL